MATPLPSAQEDPAPSTETTPAIAEEKPICIEDESKPATIDTSASSTKLPITDAEEPATPKHIAHAHPAENPTIDTSTISTEAENSIADPSTAALPEESQDRELPAGLDDTIEESFYFRNLKASQKKALLQFKAKIQQAIMDNTFLDSPKPVKTKKEEAKEEAKKEEEGDKTEEKTEEGEETEEKVEKDSQDIIEPSSDTAEVPSTDAHTKSDVIESTTRDVTLEPEVIHDEHVIPSSVVEKPSLDDLALWGVPLLHSKGDERTNVLLLKFLRAREFKVEKALNMLQDTMFWRKEFNTDSLVEEETPVDFHGSFIHGVDKEGHPVCYNRELSSKSVEDEAQLKKRIQVLEKVIQTLDFSPNGVHSMVQVIDFSGHSPTFLGRGVRSKILELLQNNYPELVSRQIFINVPWYFPPLLSLFNPRTRSKAVLAKPGRAAQTLFKYISPDQVPVQYGGLSRSNDIEFAGVEARVTEVNVKAGEQQSIILPIANAGKVVWDISVIGGGVLYDEQFVPDEGYIKIIRKVIRVAGNEEPLRNTYIAHEPGNVVLTIDNTTRRRRVVLYRYKVDVS